MITAQATDLCPPADDCCVRYVALKKEAVTRVKKDSEKVVSFDKSLILPSSGLPHVSMFTSRSSRHSQSALSAFSRRQLIICSTLRFCCTLGTGNVSSSALKTGNAELLGIDYAGSSFGDALKGTVHKRQNVRLAPVGKALQVGSHVCRSKGRLQPEETPL